VQSMTLAELLSNDAPLDKLRDRIVLVGPTNPEQTAAVTLPDGRKVAPVELAALTLTALTTQEALVIPHYARWLQLAALLLVALMLTQLLPRFSLGMALISGLVVLIALFNAQLLMFLLRSEWLPLATPCWRW